MTKIKVSINNEEMEVNLLNDYLFTKLFGEKGCEKETLHLINICTGKNFKNLSYETSEIKGKHKGNKNSTTDVLVETDDGTTINIEAQIRKQKGFHKRIHFYSSRIYSTLLNTGKDYNELPMLCMINILGFNLHKIEDYHTNFMLCEKNHRDYFMGDIIETHYIDLTKFRKKVKKGKINLHDPKDRFMLLIDVNTPQELINKVIEMDEVANNIYEKSLHVLKDKKAYLEYIRADMAERDIKGQISYAKKEGEERGIKKGIEKGMEEGKIQLAIDLKKDGVSIEQIAKSTGWTVEFIEKL